MIRIQRISITDIEIDAIVNAANSGLQAGGGVCGAIFQKAGYTELQAACDRIGHCDTGSAVITLGFGTKAKYIIHAVGPVWHGGQDREPQKLYGCYRESLRLAKEHHCHSIAFPLISAGIFGYPKDKAWRKALQACLDFLDQNPDYDMDILFAVLDDHTLKLGQAELKRQEKEKKPDQHSSDDKTLPERQDDQKRRRKEVFDDTEAYYQQNEYLKWFVRLEKKNTRLYQADEYPELPFIIPDMSDYLSGTLRIFLAPSLYGEYPEDADMERELDALEHGHAHQKPRKGTIRIDSLRTFEAAEKILKEFPDKKAAVLNFASAVSPGGGVRKGAGAQEESLCRCSTLLPALEQEWLWDQYYGPNRQERDRLNTDACIYTPDVVICKTDEDEPKRLDQEFWNVVDVIGCAAPDFRKADPERYGSEFLYQVFLKRIRHILHVAAYNQVDILILGAFGCGAFKNDPKLVAKAFREALKQYGSYFDIIEFAIPGGYDPENLQAFRSILLAPDGTEGDEA